MSTGENCDCQLYRMMEVGVLGVAVHRILTAEGRAREFAILDSGMDGVRARKTAEKVPEYSIFLIENASGWVLGRRNAFEYGAR